jgi:hypothetical protein
MDGVAVLRLRGLPFNATQPDIVRFFECFDVRDILITRTYGEPCRCWLVLESNQASRSAG